MRRLLSHLAESNRGHRLYERRALPTELRRHYFAPATPELRSASCSGKSYCLPCEAHALLERRRELRRHYLFFGIDSSSIARQIISRDGVGAKLLNDGLNGLLGNILRRDVGVGKD